MYSSLADVPTIVLGSDFIMDGTNRIKRKAPTISDKLMMMKFGQKKEQQELADRLGIPPSTLNIIIIIIINK